jgi:LysR family glycine cleavage system transcriptional activator
LLAKFFTLHPSINFELINIDINTKLISDDIDLAICYGLPNTDRLVRKLLDIHLCPIASKSLFKGKNVPASVLELLSFPILLDNEQNWEHLISASKVSPQHLAGTHSIKFFDSSHAIEAAKQGLGIALADRMEIWDELLSDSLTVLPSIQIDTDRAYYLVTDKKPTGKVSLFINWLMNELENRHV